MDDFGRPYPFMNNKQLETLNILQEECAEVIVAVSKCLRFGIDNCHPATGQSNLDHLEMELGDVLCMIELLREQNLVSAKNLADNISKKRAKLKLYSNIMSE